MPATQETPEDEQGRKLPYPFILPTPLQLLQSAFGDAHALSELGLETESVETQQEPTDSEQDPDTRRGGAAAAVSNAAGDDHRGDYPSKPRRGSRLRQETPFLRWVPFGLTRKLSDSGTSEAQPGPRGDNSENEQVFIDALSRELPKKWLEAPDGWEADAEHWVSSHYTHSGADRLWALPCSSPVSLICVPARSALTSLSLIMSLSLSLSLSFSLLPSL